MFLDTLAHYWHTSQIEQLHRNLLALTRLVLNQPTLNRTIIALLQLKDKSAILILYLKQDGSPWCAECQGFWKTVIDVLDEKLNVFFYLPSKRIPTNSSWANQWWNVVFTGYVCSFASTTILLSVIKRIEALNTHSCVSSFLCRLLARAFRAKRNKYKNTCVFFLWAMLARLSIHSQRNEKNAYVCFFPSKIISITQKGYCSAVPFFISQKQGERAYGDVLHG